jgi:replicative DNA helicase
MYDGTIKRVQDVVVGDQLMGDDSTPRNVLTLARGRETMYKVCTGKDDGYTVNESHILTLMYESLGGSEAVAKASNTGESTKETRRSFDECVQDISVLDYLASVERGESLRWKGFRVPIRFPEVPLKCCPYAIGFELGQVGGGPSSFVTKVNKGRSVDILTMAIMSLSIQMTVSNRILCS